VLGIVGFFVVPVVGLFIGFVLGVWLAEMLRLGDSGTAWRSTRHALVAVGLSILNRADRGFGRDGDLGRRGGLAGVAPAPRSRH
jgi:hypothetical protein